MENTKCSIFKMHTPFVTENPNSSHKHTYWEKQNLKMIRETMYTTRKKYAGINGASYQWRKLQNNKSYIPFYSPSHGEFKNIYFVWVAQTIWVSCAFVYGAVDLDKIVIFLAKLPSYICVQLTTLQNYSLLHFPITDEHFKPNPNSVEWYKQMLWLQNVSVCNLFSV